jgi:hypothetical protein
MKRGEELEDKVGLLDQYLEGESVVSYPPRPSFGSREAPLGDFY